MEMIFVRWSRLFMSTGKAIDSAKVKADLSAFAYAWRARGHSQAVVSCVEEGESGGGSEGHGRRESQGVTRQQRRAGEMEGMSGIWSHDADTKPGCSARWCVLDPAKRQLNVPA